jgi:hypothetical protein
VVALLPQFVDRGMGHVPLQFAVLGAIFVAFEVLIDGTVGARDRGREGRLRRRHHVGDRKPPTRTNSSESCGKSSLSGIALWAVKTPALIQIPRS